ncbi:iron-containing redox enzyme family protein [Pseudomonas sp. P9_31]|nr:iron-containing redox enzyme family protein [Pseudomonas sp. P9_31]WPN60550.1 iron-containing redox enzyme family protein [Pseudomonas sp. P9_31]
MLGAVNHQHYYKLIGLLTMTELLGPSQYEKLVQGCERLGLRKQDTSYYREHIQIDVIHAQGWLNNVVTTLATRKAEALDEFYFGAQLRLDTCAAYYDDLLKIVKSRA